MAAAGRSLAARACRRAGALVDQQTPLIGGLAEVRVGVRKVAALASAVRGSRLGGARLVAAACRRCKGALLAPTTTRRTRWIAVRTRTGRAGYWLRRPVPARRCVPVGSDQLVVRRRVAMRDGWLHRGPHAASTPFRPRFVATPSSATCWPTGADDGLGRRRGSGRHGRRRAPRCQGRRWPARGGGGDGRVGDVRLGAVMADTDLRCVDRQPRS